MSGISIPAEEQSGILIHTVAIISFNEVPRQDSAKVWSKLKAGWQSDVLMPSYQIELSNQTCPSRAWF